jgi:hypothetical protein
VQGDIHVSPKTRANRALGKKQHKFSPIVIQLLLSIKDSTKGKTRERITHREWGKGGEISFSPKIMQM